MDQKWEQVIRQIARKNGITPAEVKREMELAMIEGQKSMDPQVQAKWRSLPKKGTTLTLEDFLNYLYTEVMQQL